ncbi:MAG: hypothetical protein HKN20_13840 [Gemmatimonadetes bacterium]|nr:hypothetical protein [Gemmatimonadota bacterium]
MSPEIIDISRALTPETAPWPGDVPFSQEWTTRIADGAAVNLSSFQMSPHVGTHADSPFHVTESADGIDRVPLDRYIGYARVVTVPGKPKQVVPEHLAAFDLTMPPRILLRTGTDLDHAKFPESCTVLSPDFARLVARAGVKLVGIDTPSIDPTDSKELLAHKILHEGGVAWLENLDLTDAPDGVYLLSALPLKIPGSDASPVRAVLVRE